MQSGSCAGEWDRPRRDQPTPPPDRLARRGLTSCFCDEGRQLLSGRVTPADAERMTRRVGVHLMPLRTAEVVRPEQASAQRHRPLMCDYGVLDVKVDVYLLWLAVWPLRRPVLRRKLDAYSPLTMGIDNAVELLVLKDTPLEQRAPERALRVKIRGIEHDDGAYQLHLKSIWTRGRDPLGQCTPTPQV